MQNINWNLFWEAFGAIGTSIGSIATAIAVIVAVIQLKQPKKEKIKIKSYKKMNIDLENNKTTTIIQILIINDGFKLAHIESIGCEVNNRFYDLIENAVRVNFNPNKLPIDLKPNDFLEIDIEPHTVYDCIKLSPAKINKYCFMCEDYLHRRYKTKVLFCNKP